jgi:hypothetical protein
MRWTEEITLVQEEMHRVCAYFSWYENWWSSRADVGHMRDYGSDPFLLEGLAAYAERQAYLRMSLRCRFQGLWGDVAAWVTGQKVFDGNMPDSDEEIDEKDD